MKKYLKTTLLFLICIVLTFIIFTAEHRDTFAGFKFVTHFWTGETPSLEIRTQADPLREQKI